MPVFEFIGETMIYTLTINPSLDYVMEIETLSVGKMNRSKHTYILPGGKGINVSTVLTNLGIENIAILPVSGFTGKKILELLGEKGVHYDALEIGGDDTRINVKVLGDKETELNAKGSALSDTEIEKLLGKLDALCENDILVLSGSIPSNLGTSFYETVMKRVNTKGVKVVLDTIDEGFLKALPQKPFFVKPNQTELENMFEKKARTKEELTLLAQNVQSMGAKNVLVSLGSKGAMLLTEDRDVIFEKAPQGKVINTVGAGDSMVAGFLAEYMKTGDFAAALKMGIASGSASAFSKNLATKEEIDALRKNL